MNKKVEMEEKKVIECSEPWFGYLRGRTKPVEGRKGNAKWVSIKQGDVITFLNTDNKSESFEAKVIKVNKYGPYPEEEEKDPLKEYLIAETLEKALPGVKTLEEGMKTYRKWWKNAKEIREDGVLGIHVVPL
jgi:ASC-1-like (ASCH) protein